MKTARNLLLRRHEHMGDMGVGVSREPRRTQAYSVPPLRSDF